MYKLSLRGLPKQYCIIVQILGYNIFLIIYIFLLPQIYGKQPDKCNMTLFTSFAKLTEPPLFFLRKKKISRCNATFLQVWAGLLDYFISLLSTLSSNKEH